MDEKLRFAYDKEGDVLDISMGEPRKAISTEIEDDFYVRKDLSTNKIVGFSILNFSKWFKSINEYRVIPIRAKFTVSSNEGR